MLGAELGESADPAWIPVASPVGMLDWAVGLAKDGEPAMPALPNVAAVLAKPAVPDEPAVLAELAAPAVLC